MKALIAVATLRMIGQTFPDTATLPPAAQDGVDHGTLVWATLPDTANLSNLVYDSSTNTVSEDPTKVAQRVGRHNVMKNLSAVTDAPTKAVLIAIIKELSLDN